MSAAPSLAGRASVAVWDPLIRVLHWTLAPAVLLAYATGDHGGAWHERIGYVALAAACVRVAWGFVGSRRARFGDFVPAPRALAAYVAALRAGREPRDVGHNPLGGAWIVLMLGLAVASGGTGWALAVLGEHGHRTLEHWHEGLANALLAAAAVHVVGVAWESLRHGENLVAAMFTGRKRPPGPEDR